MTTIELSYYSFDSDYLELINSVLEKLKELNFDHLQIGPTSTIISDDFQNLHNKFFPLINNELSKRPGLFILKISQSCKI